jgi:hypothetical protein
MLWSRGSRQLNCRRAKMHAFVSVVLPTFNCAETLLRSARSVLDQSHRDFELIIVDDDSTGETRPLSGRDSDPRIRYIRLNRNCGQSAARNAGIGASKADLIAFHFRIPMMRGSRGSWSASCRYCSESVSLPACTPISGGKISGDTFLMQAPHARHKAAQPQSPVVRRRQGRDDRAAAGVNYTAAEDSPALHRVSRVQIPRVRS